MVIRVCAASMAESTVHSRMCQATAHTCWISYSYGREALSDDVVVSVIEDIIEEGDGAER